MTASQLAQQHWNTTPLFLAEEERYRIYPWLYEAAEFRHHAGHKVLEIGCGTGADLLQFAKHGAEAFGVDITDEHLRLARQRVGDRASVGYGDARRLPFETSRFDYVYSHGVLHHSDEPSCIASEILRVLKPGGRFNIHVYARYSVIAIAGYLRHGRQFKNQIENSRDPVYIQLYTARMLRSLFGSSIDIQKYEAKPFPDRFPYFQLWPSRLGWFLVAKGERKNGGS